MNILDLALVIIALIIFYKLMKFNTTNTNITSSHNEQFKSKKNIINDNDDEFWEDPSKYVDLILKSTPKVNKYFIESQFHQDYRDTINAFSLLTPNKKQIFNAMDLPIKTNSPPKSEVKKLVKKFIKEINSTIKKYVNDNLTPNSWNDVMPEKRIKTGWDEQMEQLGLPSSLYTDPAPKAPIKLIKLDHAEKFETDDEIKYNVFLIVQKRDVIDQLVIKVSFVIDRRDLNLDRDFFSKSNVYETSVKIEDVSIMGFMTNHDFGKKSNKEKFYDFGGIADNFGNINDGRTVSEKQIIKTLNKKRRQYEKERRNATKH